MPTLAEPCTTCPLDCERLVETAFQAARNLLDFGASAHCGDHSRELVAAQARQSIAGTQLVLHALRRFLQVEIAHLVAEPVIDLLEVVEVDEDESEDAGGLAGAFDHCVQMFFHGEAVGNVGEQVELRAVQQVGVEVRGFDGQRC